MTSMRIVFAWLGALVMSAPGAAWAEGPQDKDTTKISVEARRVEICREGTPEFVEAEGLVTAMNARLAGMSPVEAHLPAARAMARLFAHLCFKGVPREVYGLGEADSVLALREFWRSGGHAHLSSILDWGRPALSERFYWTLPDLRRTWTRESDPKSPFFSLLCSAAAPDCGPQARGWRLRAAAFLKRFSRERQAYFGSLSQADDDSDDCAAPRKEGTPWVFGDWVACVRLGVRIEKVLPLGGLRAPTQGWLTVSGRRGHYSFCEEVRAYDLATGAAYVHQICDSAFAMGRAAGKGPHKISVPVLRVGQVPLASLREAAWMMLLADRVGEPLVIEAVRARIPDGIPFLQTSTFAGRGGGGRFGSNQTILDWRYSNEGGARAWGDLTWPEDYNDAVRAHAVELLKIAEAGFVEGCPPAPPPRHLAVPAGPGDDRVGTSKRTQEPHLVKLWEGMMSASHPSVCASRPVVPKVR